MVHGGSFRPFPTENPTKPRVFTQCWIRLGRADISPEAKWKLRQSGNRQFLAGQMESLVKPKPSKHFPPNWVALKKAPQRSQPVAEFMFGKTIDTGLLLVGSTPHCQGLRCVRLSLATKPNEVGSYPGWIKYCTNL